MHPTGIEPVTTPWKGAILPLNYGCWRGRTLQGSEKVFTPSKRTHAFGGHPAPEALDALDALGAAVVPSGDTQLSPFVIPSHVNPAFSALEHHSAFFLAGSDVDVFNEK